jgi:hypothetical protein
VERARESRGGSGGKPQRRLSGPIPLFDATTRDIPYRASRSRPHNIKPFQAATTTMTPSRPKRWNEHSALPIRRQKDTCRESENLTHRLRRPPITAGMAPNCRPPRLFLCFVYIKRLRLRFPGRSLGPHQSPSPAIWAKPGLRPTNFPFSSNIWRGTVSGNFTLLVNKEVGLQIPFAKSTRS